MRKFLVVLSLLLLAVTVSAQVRTGNIYGKITDSEGNPLPGVSVTLTGPQMAPITTVSTETGIYRFVSVPPGNKYEIAAELSGFKKSNKTGIIVTLGSNSEINLTMEVGAIEEQVTVVAQTPVVDTKKTSVGANINKESMQSLPSARDPWVVMQMAPAIMLDRENVGGNESGQQSSFFTKGDTANNGYTGSNNIWSVDGIDITDPAAQGGSALYYDFDMFEELNITTGGAADVSIQTGGIALNMVTRRGGNKMSLAGRFYLTDGFFQSENLTQELKDQGVIATNKIQNIKDFGFNAGGPLVKDKVWWWGAYGVQDIFVYTIYQTKDQSLLNNYNFKINAQLLANNRFEALVTSGAKEKLGRNAAVAKPEGDHQRGKYYWGSPVIKLQDEHVFGNNMYLSLKYSYNDAGFGWKPMTDEGLLYPVTYDSRNAKYVPYKSGTMSSWGSYYASRPRSNYQINANYFNDTFLGMSHEIKVGAEYSHKIAAHWWGNFQDYDIVRNYNSLQIDADNDGTRTTGEMARLAARQLVPRRPRQRRRRPDRRLHPGHDGQGQLQHPAGPAVRQPEGLHGRCRLRHRSLSELLLADGLRRRLGFGFGRVHGPGRGPARRFGDRRQRRRQLPVEHLVAAHRRDLGHQRHRQDRPQAGPVPVRRRHGHRLLLRQPPRHRRHRPVLVERRRQRQRGWTPSSSSARCTGIIGAAAPTPTASTACSMTTARTRPRPTPPSSAAAAATPAWPACIRATTGTTRPPSTTATSPRTSSTTRSSPPPGRARSC